MPLLFRIHGLYGTITAHLVGLARVLLSAVMIRSKKLLRL